MLILVLRCAAVASTVASSPPLHAHSSLPPIVLLLSSWGPLVTWQYHDMGLIGSVLALLFCGGSGFYMSPASFIKRPALWVELISRHRGTHMQVGSFDLPIVQCNRHLPTVTFYLQFSWV